MKETFVMKYFQDQNSRLVFLFKKMPIKKLPGNDEIIFNCITFQ